MTDEPIIWTYRGPDRFYGVPRRSLTAADFDALTPMQQQDVIASKSYVEHTKAKSKSADTQAATTPDKEGQ